MPGFELLFATLKLHSKNEAVIAALHWIFLNEGCLCLGSGDVNKDDEKGSELLPDEWNENQTLYTLRYAFQDGKKYLVKCIPVDESLLINFTGFEGGKATAMTVKAEEYIDDYSRFNKTYKNLDKLTHNLKKEVVDGVLSPPNPHRAVGAELNDDNPVSRRVRDEPTLILPRFPTNDPFRAGGVGVADLLPGDLGFGRGGGMLVNPRDLQYCGRGRPCDIGPVRDIGPMLPRGSVPPGARFDPFGPPMPERGSGRPSANRFGVPNPDHLPPPGGYDDMFG